MSALDNPDYQSVGVIAWACEGCHFLSIMILNSSIIKKNLCRVRWFNPVLWRPYPLSCGMMTMISPVLHQPSYCHACIEGVETRVREFLQKHVKWSIFITYHFNILHMFMNQILFFHIWYCFMCSMDCFQRDTCVNKCIPEEFSDTDIEKAFDASVTFSDAEPISLLQSPSNISQNSYMLSLQFMPIPTITWAYCVPVIPCHVIDFGLHWFK